MRALSVVIAIAWAMPSHAQEPQPFCKNLTPSANPLDLSVLDRNECKAGDLVAVEATALWVSQACDFNKQIVVLGRTALCTLVSSRREVRFR
jgi:hypothetical protein